MTTSRQIIDIPIRLDIDSTAPHFSRALNGLDQAAAREADSATIPTGLRELIRLRASQINGCAYCVDQHTKAADAAGESTARIAATAVWRESGLFTATERAAFSLTESITTVAQTHVPDEAWREAAVVLTASELSAVIALAVTINAWNAVGAATRAWPVES